MEDRKTISKLSDLRHAGHAVQLINLITLYRIVAFPFLLIFIFTDRLDIFKWMLIISFLTDAVDGFLARKYKANSILGAKLDSIGDDLTILAAIIALAVFKLEFLIKEWLVFAIPLLFFFIQLIAAFIRYGKMSSFHTYLAKTAAILQGLFLCSMFLFSTPSYALFYTTAIVTLLELIEEIGIVLVLPEWKTNVKGLYWVIQDRT